MASASVLRENSKNKFYNELEELKKSDSKKDERISKKLEEIAKNIRCFYCLDLQIVYKDREGMFSNLDGRGDYDIINCMCCKNNHNWVSCSSGPSSQYPGIVKRGTRQKSWMEFAGKETAISLVDKLKEKIGDL